MSTVLLKNGLVFDGSGEKPFKGSILIENDSISAIFRENEAPPPAEKSIEAEGLAISPGFIDMHSHADFILPARNHAEVLKPLVEQGITTIVGGNCGISPAPIVPDAIDQVETLATIAIARPFAYTWTGFDGFLKHMEDVPLLVNMAELAGHATLRYSFSRAGRADMPEEERNRCLDEAANALDEGACGLSFGLGYDPGMYASLDELKAFCRVAASRNKPVTLHMKAFSRLSPCYPLVTFEAHNVRALKEAIDIA
jgi:N-acyl-D-amino-acid deacylase